jgi:hypothetical protein
MPSAAQAKWNVRRSGQRCAMPLRHTQWSPIIYQNIIEFKSRNFGLRLKAHLC